MLKIFPECDPVSHCVWGAPHESLWVVVWVNVPYVSAEVRQTWDDTNRHQINYSTFIIHDLSIYSDELNCQYARRGILFKYWLKKTEVASYIPGFYNWLYVKCSNNLSRKIFLIFILLWNSQANLLVQHTIQLQLAPPFRVITWTHYLVMLYQLQGLCKIQCSSRQQLVPTNYKTTDKWIMKSWKLCNSGW